MLVSVKGAKRKVRLIHDLRRSGVNARIFLEERLVLPRLSGAVEDALDLMEDMRPGEYVLVLCADFQDAFKPLNTFRSHGFCSVLGV